MRMTRVAAVAVLGLLLVGCSTVSDPPASEGTPITVAEHEYEIVLSQETFTPGSYSFNLTNDGTVVHNLNISGPGVSDAQSDDIAPGSTGTLTVTLESGTYELWCSIGAHKSNGMDITITVN